MPEPKAAAASTNAVPISALASQQAMQPAMVSGPYVAEAVAVATALPVEVQAVPAEQPQIEHRSATVLSTAAETTQAASASAAAGSAAKLQSEATVGKTAVSMSTSADKEAALSHDQLKQSTSGRNVDIYGSSATDGTDDESSSTASASLSKLPAGPDGAVQPSLCAEGVVQNAVTGDAALEHMHASLRATKHAAKCA